MNPTPYKRPVTGESPALEVTTTAVPNDLLLQARARIRHDHAYPMEVGPHHCPGCDVEKELDALTATSDDERLVGVIEKYTVTRNNDPAGKHDDCWYFVLDPQHDEIARDALLRYATTARRRGYVALADDLERRVLDAQEAAARPHPDVMTTSAPSRSSAAGGSSSSPSVAPADRASDAKGHPKP